MIHVAVLTLAEPSPDGDTELIFVSLDGELFIPVTREPVAGDEEAITRLFEPNERGFVSMKWARRATEAWWWGEQVTDAHHYTIS